MYYAMELSLLASVAICHTITHGWQHCKSEPASATLSVVLKLKMPLEELVTNYCKTEVYFEPSGDSSIGEISIDSSISGVTFTGSDSVGGKVAERGASQAQEMCTGVGGDNPLIVCGDADVDKASNGVLQGSLHKYRTKTTIATKRFFVVKSVAKEFIEKFVQHTEKLRVGDPLSENTDIVLLVNNRSMNNMESVVKDGIKNGADCKLAENAWEVKVISISLHFLPM